MKLRITLLGTVAILFFSFLGAYAQKPKYSLEDVYQKGLFHPKSVSGFMSTSDGIYYTKQSNEGGYKIVKKSLEDADFSQTLFEANAHNLEKIRSYTLTPDQKFIILYTDGIQIYRHSSAYYIYLYDISNSKLTPIGSERVLHATLSPDNSKMCYVRDNNIYIYDIQSQKETAVTSDGKANHIINGNCDWVYEEEFGFTQAYQWSESSQYIAYYKFDESDVRQYTLQYYEDLYPRNYVYKYPKAGEDNSKVSLWLYDISQGSTSPIDLDTKEETYIPRIYWNHADHLLLVTLNRLQNQKKILDFDAAANKLNMIYEEQDKRYVEVGSDLLFLEDNSFLMTSEKDGFNHIYCVDPKGNKTKQITKGDWDIRDVYGLGADQKELYYSSTEAGAMENHIYKVELKSRKIQDLTPTAGWHDAQFTSGMKYFLDIHSTLSTIPQYILKNNSGKTIRILEDNSVFKSEYDKYDHSTPTSMKVKINGNELNALMWKPTDFDPKKKYPVLMYQYSGPGSQTVHNQFFHSNHYLHQVMIQKGYILFIVDGRGTGGRGAEFKKQTYRQLGKLESEDQIAAGKWLQKLPYVDPDRIGIWGWSYGGYMSSICIMKGADVFKTAVAVAPVTNWRYYDNIYTERYMGLPADNGAGYDENSPTSMVNKLEGNFLIIHGLADDNVHFQNTSMLVDAMIQANKKFDSEFYPNQAHGLGAGRIHAYEKILAYILENL